MIRRLLAGCVGAFWLQFCHNLASQAALVVESLPDAEIAADKVRVEQIMARCEADRTCRGIHSPEIFNRWIDIASEHEVAILIVDRDRAVYVKSPAPRRVH